MTSTTIPPTPEPVPAVLDPLAEADALRRRVGDTLIRVCQSRNHLLRAIADVDVLVDQLDAREGVSDDTALELMFSVLGDIAFHVTRATISANTAWAVAAQAADQQVRRQRR